MFQKIKCLLGWHEGPFPKGKTELTCKFCGVEAYEPHWVTRLKPSKPQEK